MRRAVLVLMLVPGLLFILNNACGQAPASFSFQAVARNSSGELIGNGNLDIRLTLTAKSDQSTVWQETHNVSTSDLGLFIVNVGTGTRTAGLPEFAEIDWSSDRYSLKVELNEGSGWEDMGTTDLLSVPYALNASSVSGLKALKVNEKDDNPADSALFEVRNKEGNTVFAVYNEGVRVYVDDNQGKSKGPKGGFAIGGFDDRKGETYEFFRVTPDSVRIYLDEGITKGPKGGFAIGGFDRSKGITEDFMHLSEDNYFIGYESGSNITSGIYNSFFGYRAGVNNTTGNSNIFIGNETGFSNIGGNWNIFLGNSVGWSNTTGYSNVILGDGAGEYNTEGAKNVILGDWAGRNNSTGSFNVFVGENSGYTNSEGISNVFMGKGSGYSNDDGSYNVFLGTLTGYNNTVGNGNVFLGQEAGELNTEGNFNVAIGTQAGYNNQTGENNVFIGFKAGLNEPGSNKLYIDNAGNNTQSAFIYGIFDENYLSFNSTVDVWENIWVNGTVYELNNLKTDTKSSNQLTGVLGKLGTLISYQYEVIPLEKGSRQAGTQIGLDPGQVESYFPYLVNVSRTGQKGINYSRLTVVLLQAVKEQQAIIEEQEARLNELEQKINRLLDK